MERFEGKIALIDGGSGDIACSTAERLMQEGATVILSSRSEDRLKEECEKLNAKGYPGKVDWMAGDALNYDRCVEIAEAVKKTYGRIDILVCAQGILIHKPIDVLTLDEWQKVVDVNMTSVFYSIKAVVPIMKEQNYGRIVLVSSIGGRKGRPGVGVNYAASKAGLVGMTQLLGYELGPWNITVNCVAPGPLAGRMLFSLSEEHIERLKEGTRIHRLGKVSEAAAAIAYLASDDAGWTTGEILDVNGGLQY